LIGTTIAMAGCAVTPSTVTPPQSGVQATGDELSPDQLMKLTDERQVMADGLSFEQMLSQLPESLSTEDAAKLLVDVDQSAFATDSYSIQQYGGHHGFIFNRHPFIFVRRAHLSPFFFRHRLRFLRFHRFFFPFFFDGIRFRRFVIDDDDIPFFLRFHQRFFPFVVPNRIRFRFNDEDVRFRFENRREGGEGRD
jgi:hypothetical protein